MSRILRTLVAAVAFFVVSAPAFSAPKVNFCGSPIVMDIVLQNFTSNQVAVWCDNNPNQTTILGTVSPGWGIFGIANFDAGGQSEIMLYNFSTAQVSIWPSGNPSAGVITGVLNTAGGYQMLNSFGDFDGDGGDDLIVYNSQQVALWYNGRAQSSVILGRLFPGWTPHMVADVNGDGQADLVLRQTNSSFQGTGLYSYWPSGNPNLSQIINAPNIYWEIMAMGNFVAGGTACDILWYHVHTGDLARTANCALNSPVINAFLGVLGWPMYPFMVDDYNGDSITDLITRHPNSTTITWMRDASPPAYATISNYLGNVGWSTITPHRVWYR